MTIYKLKAINIASFQDQLEIRLGTRQTRRRYVYKKSNTYINVELVEMPHSKILLLYKTVANDSCLPTV